jgi:short-subunit dehydrogenase
LVCPLLNEIIMNVVITGASKGIGRAIAEGFARHGADLFLCARTMDSTLHWQQDLMEQYNCSIMSMNVDMADAKAVKAFAGKVQEAFEGVDVLVNNAGVFEPGSVHAEPEGQLERMLQVNLYSAYHLTRALLPGMMKAGRGHIFNICSIAALQAYEAGGSYSISKWALRGFSANLREEMKAHGIKVTAVHPGAVMTDAWAGSGVEQSRIMGVDDIAKLVVAMQDLSPQACMEEITIRPQLGDL